MLGRTHLSVGLAIGAIVERGMFVASTISEPMNRAYEIEMVSIGNVSIPTVMLIYSAVGLGALLPDIDEPRSLIANLPNVVSKQLHKHFSKRFPEVLLRLMIEFGLILLNAVTQMLARLIRLFALGHRGATHSLLFCGVISILASLIGLGEWMLVGYLSHLALDMMTPAGVAIFWPVTQRPIRLLPKPLLIRTGSSLDRRIGTVGAFVALISIACAWLLPIISQAVLQSQGGW